MNVNNEIKIVKVKEYFIIITLKVAFYSIIWLPILRKTLSLIKNN